MFNLRDGCENEREFLLCHFRLGRRLLRPFLPTQTTLALTLGQLKFRVTHND